MRRQLLRYTQVLAATWLVYLTLANAWLNSPLPDRWINRQPERFQIHWDNGLSLWPGQVVLWNLKLQGQANRVRWYGHADRAHGRIALLPLFGKTLRIPSVRGNNTHVHILEADIALPPPPARPGGWTIRLDSAATDTLRSLRVQDVRIAGTGSAQVGLIKTLRGGDMELTPSRLRIEHAVAVDEHRTWLQDGDIDLQVALAGHRRDEAQGLDRLRFLDGRLSVRGATPGLVLRQDDSRWLAELFELGQTPGTTVMAQPGKLDVAIDIERGQLRPGGKANLRLPLQGLAINTPESWHAEAGLALSVAEDDIRVRMTLPPPPGDSGNIDVDLSLAGRALPMDSDWPEQLRRLSGQIDVDWHFQSLQWLDRALTRFPWLGFQGSGRVSGTLQLAQGGLAPGSRLEVPQIEARIDVLDNRFSGQGRAIAEVTGESGATRNRVQLHVDQFRMAPTDKPDSVFVQGRDLVLDLSGTGQLFEVRDSFSGRLHFSDAVVPDLGVYNHYLPGDAVTLLGGGARLAGDLSLDNGGDVGKARIRIDSQSLRIELGDRRFSTRLDIDARLSAADLAQRRFDLAGTTVHLANLQALDSQRPTNPDWWTRLNIARGELAWSRPWDLDAHLVAQAHSAAPLLSLMTRRRHMPAWLHPVVDDGQVQMSGRLRMTQGRVRVDPLQISNDRYDVSARFQVAARKLTGHLLAQWRRLSVGVELGAEERDWHLHNAREWFEGTRLAD